MTNLFADEPVSLDILLAGNVENPANSRHVTGREFLEIPVGGAGNVHFVRQSGRLHLGGDVDRVPE